MQTYDNTRPNVDVEELRKRRGDGAYSISIDEFTSRKNREIRINTKAGVCLTFGFKKDSRLRNGGKLTLAIDGQLMMNPYSTRDQTSDVEVYSDTGRITVGQDFEVVVDGTWVHYTATKIRL